MALKDKLQKEAQERISKVEIPESEEVGGKEDSTGKIGFSLANNSFFQKEKKKAEEELKAYESVLWRLNLLKDNLPDHFDFKQKASETTKEAKDELEKIYNENKTLLNGKGILSVQDLIDSYSEDEEVVGYKDAQNTEKLIGEADLELEKTADQLGVSRNINEGSLSQNTLIDKIKSVQESLKISEAKFRSIEMKETIEKISLTQITPEFGISSDRNFQLLVNDTNLEASKVLKPQELAVASIIKNRQFFDNKRNIDSLNYNISHRYNDLVRDEEQYHKLLEELRISKKLETETDENSRIKENILNQKGLIESASKMARENEDKIGEKLYHINKKIEESRDKRLIDISKKVFEFMAGPLRIYGGLPDSVVKSKFTKFYFDDISDWNTKYNELLLKTEKMVDLLDKRNSSDSSIESIEQILETVNKEEVYQDCKPKTDLIEILRRYQSNIDKDFMDYRSRSSDILDREDLMDIIKEEIANRITSLSESRIPMSQDNMYRSKASFVNEVISSHGASLVEQAKKLPLLSNYKSLFSDKAFQSGNSIPEVERGMKYTVENINLHKEYGEYMVPRLEALREELKEYLDKEISVSMDKLENIGEQDADKKIYHLDQVLKRKKENEIRDAENALKLEKEKGWMKRSSKEVTRLEGIIAKAKGEELKDGDISWKRKNESELTLNEIYAYMQNIRDEQKNAGTLNARIANAFDGAFSGLPEAYTLRTGVGYNTTKELNTVEKYLKYWETFFEGWKDQTIYQRYGNEDIELSADQRAFVYDYMTKHPVEKEG